MDRRTALKNTALLGSTAAISTAFLGLLQSCQQEDRLTWNPKFLSTDHAKLVSALVDTILPTTDTPGGVDVKVDILIDLLYAKALDQEAQAKVVQELDLFNEKCRSKFGKDFHQLNGDERNSVLEAEEASSPQFGGSVWGYPVGKQEAVGFYRSFKSMAIMGYCTSEEIGKNVLNYDPVPGEFLPCIPLSDVEKVWSL